MNAYSPWYVSFLTNGPHNLELTSYSFSLRESRQSPQPAAVPLLSNKTKNVCLDENCKKRKIFNFSLFAVFIQTHVFRLINVFGVGKIPSLEERKRKGGRVKLL